MATKKNGWRAMARVALERRLEVMARADRHAARLGLDPDLVALAIMTDGSLTEAERADELRAALEWAGEC